VRFGADGVAGVRIADRAYFERARQGDEGLLFSEPLVSRISGKWVLILARRLTRPDGSFGGVVTAGIGVESLAATFATVDLGKHGAITLRDAALRLVARYPAPAASGSGVGSANVSAQLMEGLRTEGEAGSYVAASVLDGIERVNAYRQVGRLPFHVIVGISSEQWRAAARREAAEMGALAALAVALTVFLSWLLHGAWRRRELALAVAETQSARNALMLRNASDGLHVIDSEGKVVVASDAFCAMLGRPRDRVLGMNVREWDPRWSADQSRAGFKWLLRESGHSVFETRFVRPDGSLLDVEVSVTAVDYDGRPALFCAARDITDRKRAEQELARLNRELEQMALRDPLTRLFNRRYLDETLPRELSQAERNGSAVSFVLLDLDHFKRINDTRGHRAGDTLLQAVAALLRESTRAGDIACRYGGEEFLLVLPGSAAETALQRVEALRTAISRLRIAFGGSELGVTVSAGVATFPEHGRTADDLILQADAALYAAKRAGRNRVHMPPSEKSYRAAG